MPKGYWVAKANITDHEKLARYGEQADLVIKKYGGKFLVRGGKQKTKEGTNFIRNVVVEFDSYDLALSAYSSSEYKKALEILDGGAERMYAVVEGCE